MKGIIVFVVLLTICCFAGGLYFGYQTSKDQGHQLAMAFSDVSAEIMQVQCGVGTSLTMFDPPKTNSRGVPLWPEWIDDHFTVRDADGKKLLFRRMGTSRLFLDDRAAGSPEFVLHVDLKKGETYTFDYLEVRGEDKLYRYVLTIPNEPEKVRRHLFERCFDEDA